MTYANFPKMLMVSPINTVLETYTIPPVSCRILRLAKLLLDEWFKSLRFVTLFNHPKQTQT